MSAAEFGRIHERLDDLLKTVGKIDTDLQSYVAASGPCRAKCEKHDGTLYGNGKTGLVSKVNLLMWILGLTVTALVAVIGAAAERYFS